MVSPDAAESPMTDATVKTADAARQVDASEPADASPGAADAAATGDGGAAYRHTIAIDGTNDFSGVADAFATTSASYAAYVSWDDSTLYVGYDGEDIGSGDPQKWVLVYLDTDPGAGTGAAVGEQYNTQQPGFPTGFGAEYYYRWKASNDFQSVQVYGAGTWSDSGASVQAYQSGTFLEVAIPLSALGSPARLGIVGLMLNETDLAEAAYAGLYEGNFADGYYDAGTAPIPITTYLDVDFAASRAPNDAANKKP